MEIKGSQVFEQVVSSTNKLKRRYLPRKIKNPTRHLTKYFNASKYLQEVMPTQRDEPNTGGHVYVHEQRYKPNRSKPIDLFGRRIPAGYFAADRDGSPDKPGTSCKC